MKKYFKIFYIFFVVIVLLLSNNIKATESSCDNYKNGDAIAACKYAKEYCKNGIKIEKGCKPDSTFYDKSGNVSAWTIFRGTMSIPSTKISKGYFSVNSNGEGVYVGCYKYYNKIKQGGGIYGSWPIGWYYVFIAFEPNENACSRSSDNIDIVPGGVFGNYEGNNAIGFDDGSWYWKGKLDTESECPKFFAYAGNSTWLTLDRNKRVFTDNIEDIEGRNVSRFLSSGDYEYTYGCTVKDNDNFSKLLSCYDKAINDLNNITCPKDLSDISVYKSKLDGLAKSCSNEFEVMYSMDFLNKNKEEFKTKLNEAVNSKLNSCQYENCNLTASQVTRLSEELNKNQCETNCAKKTDQSEYEKCIACITLSIDQAKLSSTQKECLLKSQNKIEEAIEELEDLNEKDQQEHVEEELEEQQQIREDLDNAYADKYGYDDVEIPEIPEGEITECNKILGENLSKVVKASITILQIVGAILAIVKGMMVLVPPIVAKDADALQKAGKTLAYMAVILVIIFLFKPLLRFMGDILEFDTTCII